MSAADVLSLIIGTGVGLAVYLFGYSQGRRSRW